MVNFDPAIPVGFDGSITNSVNHIPIMKAIRNEFHSTANLSHSICNLQKQNLKMLSRLNNFIDIAYAFAASRSIPTAYCNVISDTFKKQWQLSNEFSKKDIFKSHSKMFGKVYRLIVSKNCAKYVKNINFLSILRDESFSFFKRIFPLYKNVTHFSMTCCIKHKLSFNKILQLMTSFRNIESVGAAIKSSKVHNAVVDNLLLKRLAKLKSITLKNKYFEDIKESLEPFLKVIKKNGIVFNIPYSMFAFSDNDFGNGGKKLVPLCSYFIEHYWLDSFVKSIPLEMLQKVVKFRAKIVNGDIPSKFSKFLVSLIKNATNLHSFKISIHYHCSEEHVNLIVAALRAVGKDLNVKTLQLLDRDYSIRSTNVSLPEIALNMQSLHLMGFHLSQNCNMPNLKRLECELDAKNSEKETLQILNNAPHLEELKADYCSIAHFKETRIFGHEFKTLCKNLRIINFEINDFTDSLIDFVAYLIVKLPESLEVLYMTCFSYNSSIAKSSSYYCDCCPTLASARKYIMQLKRLQKIGITCKSEHSEALDHFKSVIPKHVEFKIEFFSR